MKHEIKEEPMEDTSFGQDENCSPNTFVKVEAKSEDEIKDESTEGDAHVSNGISNGSEINIKEEPLEDSDVESKRTSRRGKKRKSIAENGTDDDDDKSNSSRSRKKRVKREKSSEGENSDFEKVFP